ncbi:MAG: hypothetical protein V1837_00725 [Candidatus Woesearchaeota archaeon]
MRQLCVIIIVITLLCIGCTSIKNKDAQNNKIDSIINKIDNNKISELTEEERAIWGNVVDKANRGEELSPDETKLQERLEQLTKEQNPSRFLPDKCVLRPPFNCVDFNVSKSQIELTISHSFGNDLKNIAVSVNSCQESSTIDVLKDRNSNTFVLEKCNNTQSEDTNKLKEEILIKYQDSSGSLQSSIGELFSKVN